MLQFPSPVLHRMRLGGALFLLLAGLLVALRPAPQQAPAVVSVQPVLPSAPEPVLPPTPTGTVRLSAEISLQETLDRLGFTVNVPRTYAGYPVWQWGAYRVSDRSDAVDAEQFTLEGSAHFQRLSLQSYLGPRSTFGFVTADGNRTSLLHPTHFPGLWLSRDAGQLASTDQTGAVRFYMDHPQTEMFGPQANVPLYSTHTDNPDQSTQLLVLPARVGGSWVGGQAGHWEGGIDTGGLLLCWEDLPNGDHDFQDMVVLATGLSPR